MLVQQRRDERQRTAGDAAAAGFFARMRGIEDADACAPFREQIGRESARWPAADDRDITRVRHCSSLRFRRSRLAGGPRQVYSRGMSHPLVFALFGSRDAAFAAGRAVQALGVSSRAISVVARTHQEEGVLAQSHRRHARRGNRRFADRRRSSANSAGSRLAAAALVMPGLGAVVTAGPLSAELGEMAGHFAGSLAEILESTGIRRGQSPALAGARAEWRRPAGRSRGRGRRGARRRYARAWRGRTMSRSGNGRDDLP